MRIARSISVPLALLLLAASSCSNQVVTLTLAAPDGSTLTGATLDLSSKTQVFGSHCVFWPLGFPVIFPRVDAAVADALNRQRDASVLIDIVGNRVEYPVLLFSLTCMEVEGTAVSLTGKPAP
jgi:hypothetical protein